MIRKYSRPANTSSSLYCLTGRQAERYSPYLLEDGRLMEQWMFKTATELGSISKREALTSCHASLSRNDSMRNFGLLLGGGHSLVILVISFLGLCSLAQCPIRVR